MTTRALRPEGGVANAQVTARRVEADSRPGLRPRLGGMTDRARRKRNAARARPVFDVEPPESCGRPAP